MAKARGTSPPAPQTFPVVTGPNGQPATWAFDHYWPVQNDIILHLNAARIGLSKKDGGLGRCRHVLEAHNLIWPEDLKTLHAWKVERFKELTSGTKFISFAGGSGIGKSHDVAQYALLWWWQNPSERAVIIASTTIQMLKKRIWSYVSSSWWKATGNMPGLISSHPHPSILYSREDEVHGIHGMAIREGEADRVLKDMIGIHPKEGLLVIVDESSDVSMAIEQAITNWDSCGISFQMALIANSKDRFDLHGKFSEPENGWTSVDPDKDTRWKTKKGGVCLFFDCYKSPAIVSKDKARFPFLINQNQIDDKERELGKDSPRFWRFVRGFWPPEDASKTVCTLAMIEKYHAKLKAFWSGDWRITIAALDPAFTSEGDECILRFADLGRRTDGRMSIDFGGPDNILSLQLNSRSKEPVGYQILQQAREACRARGVPPEHCGIDTWGFGTGVGDIAEKEWSPNIHRIIGIGHPSDKYIDNDMKDKANEVYDRKTTEMWFALKTFIESDQVRGLDDTTVEELCSRQWMWKGRKMALEQKKEYKRRMGREDSPTGSPDRADAAVIIIEVAQRLGYHPDGRVDLIGTDKADWERQWQFERGRPVEMGESADSEFVTQDDYILDGDAFSENAFD